MEDASKAIEIAVGAILFMIAVTMSIILYTRMIKMTKNALYINSTNTNVLFTDEDIEKELVYSKAEVRYMLEGIKNNYVNNAEYSLYTDDFKIILEGSTYNNIDATQINSVIDLINKEKYDITYKYEYTNSGTNVVNNHLLSEMTINENI